MAVKYPAYQFTDKRSTEIPNKKRVTTDIVCAVIFVLVFLAGIGGGVYGLIKGDTRNIAQPYDTDGNACGQKLGKAADFPYLYFNDLIAGLNKSNVCIKKCPTSNTDPIECLPNETFTE